MIMLGGESLIYRGVNIMNNMIYLHDLFTCSSSRSLRSNHDKDDVVA